MLTGWRKSSHTLEVKMECPRCKHEIPESLLKTWWASLGGKASKRTISPEQQKKMQAWRLKDKKEGK